MKKMSALALALLVFVLLVQAKILDEILDVEDQIKQATQALFGNAASQSEGPEPAYPRGCEPGR